ncbi:MAG: acyltransferase [Sphingobium sp.]
MKPAKHIPALDGVRGMAAILVLISHFHAANLPDLISSRLGDYGVMLFFVLSGFLMGHLYLGKEPDRNAIIGYAAARVGRIVPLYAIVALASFVIYNSIDPEFVYRIDSVQLLRLGTLTSSEAVFWSIGPEFQFYFLFPLIWMAFHAPPRHRAAALGVIGLLVAITYWFSPLAPGFSVFSKLHIFVTGILLSLAVRRLSDETKARLRLPAEMFSIAFILILLFPTDWARALLLPPTQGDPKHLGYYGDPLKILACALLILTATLQGRVANAAWANPLMRKLGAYSFSIYLLHMPSFHLAKLLAEYFGLSITVQAILAVILSLAIAFLSFHIIERPLNARVRAAFQRRTGTRAVGAAT